MRRTTIAPTLPQDDTVVISIPTTRWVMEQIQRHAESGRYPRSFSACAEEFLRAALREEERSRPHGPRRASSPSKNRKAR